MTVIPPNTIVPGTVARIFQNETVTNPHLQIIFAKSMDKDSSGQPRWKIALSDTVNFIQGVALSPVNPYFEGKMIEPGAIVKITKYSMASLKGHYIMLLGDIDPSCTIKMDGKLGEPSNIELSNAAPAASTAAAAPVPVQASVSAPSAAYNSGNTFNGGGNSYSRPAGMATAEYAPGPSASNLGGQGASSAWNNGGNTSAAASNFTNTSAQMTSNDDQIYTPISGLTPYQNTFAIKARCTHKSDVRTWAKEKSSGKLFSINLIDSSGEIKCTGFNDVVDKFYDLFQVGQVYSISGASVKMSNKRYSNVKNDYELYLEGNSSIQLMADSPNGIPAERYNFIPIGSLNDVQKDEVIDVLGVAHDVGDLGSITVKSTGKQLTKRDITLVDTTGSGVRVTLWGREAEQFSDFKNRAVVAIKSARVSDYNGRTLSTLSSSVVSVNPDLKEAFELRGWYDSTGYSQSPAMMSQAGAVPGAAAGSGRDERKLISQIKEENLGQFEKPDYANIIATITFIRAEGNLYYTACPTEGCAKKMQDDGPGMWRCERCQKVFDRCDYRYILSAQVSDESGQTWLNVFNETGAAILGMPAEELHRLKLEDEEAFKKVFEKAQLQPFLFKLRIKQEQYNGEMKIRSTVISALPLAHSDESKRLIAKIDPVLFA